MNKTHTSKEIAPAVVAEAATGSRYHLYLQTRTGTYSVAFKTNSAAEAVEAFLNQSPAFEGGEIRLWNQQEQRVSALVEWSAERTDFGFPVFNRTNVFHDRLLELIARQMQLREEIREEIQHNLRMSA